MGGVWNLPRPVGLPDSLREWLEIDLWPEGGTRSNEVSPPWRTSGMIHAHVCAPHSLGSWDTMLLLREPEPFLPGSQWPTFLSFGGHILHPHATDPAVKESEEQNASRVILGKEIFLKG